MEASVQADMADANQSDAAATASFNRDVAAEESQILVEVDGIKEEEEEADVRHIPGDVRRNGQGYGSMRKVDCGWKDLSDGKREDNDKLITNCDMPEYGIEAPEMDESELDVGAIHLQDDQNGNKLVVRNTDDVDTISHITTMSQQSTYSKDEVELAKIIGNEPS
jgi:hypothetical protein